MNRSLPSLSVLTEKFQYSPDSGTFYSHITGKNVGSINNRGYVSLYINNQYYQAHRIAYYMQSNVDPGEMMVDHIDGNRSNNCWNNLQLVTNQQNQHKSKVCNNNPQTIKGKYTEHGKKVHAQQVRKHRRSCKQADRQ